MVGLTEHEKQTLLAQSEITLLLNSYDDIFSDFDPRPYSRRAVSDDFLAEAKRAARDKDGHIELRFLIPQHQRKIDHETAIKLRLRAHFKHHNELEEIEMAKTKRNGWLMAIAGILMIIAATYLSSLESSLIWIHFLIILLEPGGWFTAWTGLDQLYYTAKEKKPDYDFYHKMTKANIFFTPY